MTVLQPCCQSSSIYGQAAIGLEAAGGSSTWVCSRRPWPVDGVWCERPTLVSATCSSGRTWIRLPCAFCSSPLQL